MKKAINRMGSVGALLIKLETINASRHFDIQEKINKLQAAAEKGEITYWYIKV
jgi:hypothetical protein